MIIFIAVAKIHGQRVPLAFEDEASYNGAAAPRMYWEGTYPPHYPVPAIPVECNIGVSSVFFWTNSSEYKNYPRTCKVIWKDWHHA
jgi:hypothetical protein